MIWREMCLFDYARDFSHNIISWYSIYFVVIARDEVSFLIHKYRISQINSHTDTYICITLSLNLFPGWSLFEVLAGRLRKMPRSRGDVNFRSLFQDFNASKFIIFTSLLIFSLLYALKLDRVLNWSWWSIFIPIWIWKGIVGKTSLEKDNMTMRKILEIIFHGYKK